MLSLAHKFIYRSIGRTYAQCESQVQGDESVWTPSVTVGGPRVAGAESLSRVAHLNELLMARPAESHEAWSLHQALQHQESADALRLMAMLRNHDLASAAAMEDAKFEIEKRVVERMRDEQDAMRELNRSQLQALSDEYSSHLREAIQLAAATTHEKLEEVVAVERAAAHATQQQAVLGERQAYLSALKQLELDVDILAKVLSHDSRYKRASHAVLQLSAVTRSLDTWSSTSCHTSVLTAVSDRLGDELLNELTCTISSAETQAPMTLKQLQARFNRVQTAGQQAVLVPDGSGMWGHALAAVVTAVMSVSQIARGNGETRFEASGVLARAADWLEQDNLLEAVREIRSLQGQPASSCSGWLASAEHRLLMEQAETHHSKPNAGQ